MKLIAENDREDTLIPRLSALLCDLGVPTDGYLQEDTIALTFLSSYDLDLETNASQLMTQSEFKTFLMSIEGAMKAAMHRAGERVVYSALSHCQGGHAKLNARALSE